MQVVVAARSMTVAVEQGRASIHLEAHAPVLMHDVEVASGRAAGAFASAEPAPPVPRRFDPADDLRGRLLAPFIGGPGDAVCLLPVLAAISRRWPAVALEVATTPGPAEVFALCPHVQRIVSHPVPLRVWRQYDHYLTLEAVYETGQTPGQPLAEVFATAIGLRLREWSFDLRLPRAADAADDRMPMPMVAVAAGESPSLRSYPPEHLRRLVLELVEAGVCCVLLGRASDGASIAACPPLINDLRGQTPSVLELAVWLRAADVVVGHDSFVMHLAGALRRPTVALFAPTSRRHAATYDRMTALAGSAPCAPCHETGARCPKGFARCIAWDDAALSPGAVAESVLQNLGSRRPGARPAMAGN